MQSRSENYLGFTLAKFHFVLNWSSMNVILIGSSEQILSVLISRIEVEQLLYFVTESPPLYKIWLPQLYDSFNGRRIPKDSWCEVAFFFPFLIEVWPINKGTEVTTGAKYCYLVDAPMLKYRFWHFINSVLQFEGSLGNLIANFSSWMISLVCISENIN